MGFGRHLKQAVRSLSKSPGFTVTTVTTLALGIGATTAIFSVCDAMLWKPVPLPNEDSLYVVVQSVPGEPHGWNPIPPADASDIRDQETAWQGFAVYTNGLANIASSGERPERVEQALVSADFFDVIGAKPLRGRTFIKGEDELGRHREAVLSENFWRRRFGAAANIVNSIIRLDDEDYTVIGIMPKSFGFPLATEVWTPLAFKPADRVSRTGGWVEGIARLKPGRTAGDASAELDAIARRLENLHPDTNTNRRFSLTPSAAFLIGYENRQYALMLFGAVLFVLLIACVNVANLQFARATGRTREAAIRSALGAGRAGLLARMLMESLLLSLAGGLLGILIASWGVATIHAGMPPRIARYVHGWDEMGADWRTILFMLAAASASGLLAGILPAWQVSRADLARGLRDGGRSVSGGRGRRRLRAILVAAEVSLAVVLLVGGGLMVRGFQSLVNAANRLEPETVLALRLSLTETKYKDDFRVAAYYRTVLQRIAVQPGVKSVAIATALPYSDHSSGRSFTIEGHAPIRPEPSARYQAVSADYFDTLHIPLIRGRKLMQSDGPDAPRVAVIGERMERRWFPNESAIGRRIRLGAEDSTSPWITIVGVVTDVTHDVYERAPRPAIYVPFEQMPGRWMDVGVRTAGDPLAVAPSVLAAVRGVDADQPITQVASLETWRHEESIGMNYMAVLMGVFGVLALVLATIGVYGVMEYLVSEQTQEIGIRAALGAQRSNVLAMVFRRGAMTVLAGLAAGLVMAYGFSRLLASLVLGVSSTDPASFIGIPLTLIAAAAIAIYVPARRAMKIDPIIALRYE
ncbi:MAG: ABC transporter permease [Acidobacteriota bacterium]|nr:ABC transporter permease [Acidobacteriota bacterium]